MSLGTPPANLPRTGWIEAILWRLGRRQSVVVQGDSMAPLIVEGDELLFTPTNRPRVNDIVLAQHPTNAAIVLIKMVDSIREGEFYLTGINQSTSSDSRDFGWLSNDLLLGRVTSRIGT